MKGQDGLCRVTTSLLMLREQLMNTAHGRPAEWPPRPDGSAWLCSCSAGFQEDVGEP